MADKNQEEELCPFCEEEFLPGDLKVEIASIKVEENNEVIIGHQGYHSFCFMDIVNVESEIGEETEEKIPVGRSNIMEGTVKIEGEGKEARLVIEE